MTNKQLKKALWQLGIYGGVLGYIACDLFVFHGPLAQKIDSKDPLSAKNIAAAKQRGVVARVFNHDITLGQVERAAHERLWRLGQKYDDFPKSQRKLLRYAALDDLIDHELLRIKAMAHAEKLILDPQTLDARVERFNRRFSGDKARLSAMKAQGIANDQDLRDRIAAQMQQEAYIELKIGPLSEVTEEEAKEWFDKNQQTLANPEHRHLRHIFLPSLDISKEDALPRLEAAKASLASGQADFATLAKEISHDPASKHQGGNLGWVNRQRLPEDFADAVWKLPANQPTLITTKIGWHLVELLGEQPAQTPSFDDARKGIVQSLQSVKRREAIKDYRKALRKWEGHRVAVYHDMMK